MSEEEREQNPHYAPELDPANSGWDGGRETDLIFIFSYVLATIVAVFVLFGIEQRAAGFFTIGASVLTLLVSFWLLQRRARNEKTDAEGATPNEAREQSPHYIPELDPANPRRPRWFSQPLFGLSLCGGPVFLVAAYGASTIGVDWLVGGLVATGLILLSPLLIFAGWSGNGS